MARQKLITIALFIFLLLNFETAQALNILEAIGKVKDKAVSLVRKDIPQTVAVLPVLGNGTEEDKRLLRETFNNHISSKKFLNVKLDDIDIKLAEIEKETGKKWYQLDYKLLGKKLGVEGLFVVELLDIQKIYAAVFASLSIKIRVSFIRVKDGKIIWQKVESVAKRSGGLPTSPWGAISTAISSALVLRESVKIALMDELCRKLASEIPEPSKLVVRKPPPIFAVMTNAKDSPFGIGKEVLVAVRGKESCLAYMEIEGLKARIKLLETKPGYYLGKYVVSEGDNLKNAHIRVSLFDPKTRLESEYIVQYPIEIDGIPPAPVSDFRITNTGKGLHLTWKAVEDAVEYVVERNRGNRFEKIGTTQIPEFYDGNVTEGETYYYRIFSKDKAGNLGKPVEKKITYVKPGPTFLPTTLVGSVTLYAAGSPYVVNGTVKVVKGAHVFAEEGVVVSFENGSTLLVQGKFEALGSKDDEVVFRGKGYRIKVEDAGDRGFVAKNAIFEGGFSFEIVNSGVVFDDVFVRNFDMGIILGTDSLLKAHKLRIADSEKALIFRGGALTGDVFMQGNAYALCYEKGGISEAQISFGKNEVYVNATAHISISEVEVNKEVEGDLWGFVAGLVNCDIGLIKPLNVSLQQLKEELYEEVKFSVIKALLATDRNRVESFIGLVRNFQEITFKDREFWSFVFHYLGRETESDLYLSGVSEKLQNILREAFKGQAYRIVLREVRIPKMVSSDSGWELFAKRAKKRVIYDFVESSVPKLTVKKRLIVEKEIIPSVDKYVPAVFFLGKRDENIFSSYYFMLILNKKLLSKDLVYYNIIVPEKRQTKLALVFCTDKSVVERIKVFFGDLRYSYITIPCSKGATYVDYLEKLKGSKVDLLLIFNSAVTKLKSKLGSNLNLYNAVVNLSMVDVKTGREVGSCSAGGFTYHFNDVEGRRTALINAFEKLTDGLEAKLLMYEKRKISSKSAEGN